MIRLIIFLLLLTGCSYIDKNDPPENLPQSVKVGLYVESGIRLRKAAAVADDIVDEFLQHGLDIRIVYLMPWSRQGDSIESILSNVKKLPRGNADKILCMISATPEDYFRAHFAFQPLGICAGRRDVAVAIIDPIAPFMTDSTVAVHEAYHLFGWGHR